MKRMPENKPFDKLPKVTHQVTDDWRGDLHRMRGDVDMMQYHLSALKFAKDEDMPAIRHHLTNLHRFQQNINEALARIDAQLAPPVAIAESSVTPSESAPPVDASSEPAPGFKEAVAEKKDIDNVPF